MSYILDALRRADAERGRGGVPSIHTQQQFTPLEADDDRERSPTRRIGWIAGGLGVALIGAVAWIVLRPEPAPVATTAPSPRAVTPLPAAPNTPPTPVEAPAALPRTAATEPPATARTEPPPRSHGARATARAEERTARPKSAARPTAIDGDEAPRAAAGSAREGAARPERAASSADSADRVYAMRDLPEDVRRALPAITVSGSTWSNDSASRMLMIGGQIYHEGDSVAPGVALERIKPHAAVLAFRGYRYELTF